MSFVIRRCTAKLPTPSYQMSNLQLICERFGARSQTSNERHSMMVSAFKRIQDVPFPTWTRKILYRWLMGAEVCARVTSRVQSSPVQSSPVQSASTNPVGSLLHARPARIRPNTIASHHRPRSTARYLGPLSYWELQQRSSRDSPPGRRARRQQQRRQSSLQIASTLVRVRKGTSTSLCAQASSGSCS